MKIKLSYAAILLLMLAAVFRSAFYDNDDDDDKDSDGTVSVSSYTLCPDSLHPHAIDLDLPSGTKWACCNVGATAPEADGDYFAWGETKPKCDYSWDTYKWGDGDTFTKYNKSDGKIILDAVDDAATQNMGKGWRMPTLVEFKELVDNCHASWTEENGIKGYKFVSLKNAASVFFPASGYRCGFPESFLAFLHGHSFGYHGSNGYYWLNTLFSIDGYNSAINCHFDSRNCNLCRSNRCYSRTVRAVCQ